MRSVGTEVRNWSAYDAAVQGQIHARATEKRRRAWLAGDDTRQALIDWLQTEARGGFAEKMCGAFMDWGTLTTGQEKAVRAMRDRATAKAADKAATDATATWVGEVGRREVFKDLTVAGVYEDDGPYGRTYAHKLTDAAGNTLYWRTGHRIAERDEKVTLLGTVKAHHTAKATGHKATILTRCKAIVEIALVDGQIRETKI